MAHDPKLKEDLGIYYETHDALPKELVRLEQFKTLTARTIYDWIKQEGWIKNKYKSAKQRIADRVSKDVGDFLGEEAKKVLDEIADPDDNRASQLAKELVRQVLPIDEIHKAASESFRKAEAIMRVSEKSIAVHSEFLNICKEYTGLIYGKSPDAVTQNNIYLNASPADMTNMTDDQLRALASRTGHIQEQIHQAKEEVIIDGTLQRED